MNRTKTRVGRIFPERPQVATDFTDSPSMTEQTHKKECDMNYILKEYNETGLIRHAHQFQGQYDDVSSIDFQQAMDVVADTKSMFEALPSATRANFNHDPKEFLAFVQNPENGVKMQEMGITPGIDGLNRNNENIPGMADMINSLNTIAEKLNPEGGDKLVEPPSTPPVQPK